MNLRTITYSVKHKIIDYNCNSNAFTAEDAFCNCEGVFVNGFVEEGDSIVKSWDLSKPVAGETLSLVASAAHSASNGSSRTTAMSLLHTPFCLISTIKGGPKIVQWLFERVFGRSSLKMGALDYRTNMSLI